MNGTTLKALRLALGFTQEEAANMIGAVSIRTWRYWEDEGRTIPADVIVTVRDLISFKQMLINRVKSQIDELMLKHDQPERIAITYYATLDDWMTQDGAEPMQWKPHCMAMGALAEMFNFVTLISFDAVKYQEWLGNSLDDSATRSHWAALQ
jgi:transcriptional regulator with XRE-family HTH domain